MIALESINIPGLEYVWQALQVSFHAIQGRLLEVFSVLYLSLVVTILLLERRWPAEPAQNMFGVAIFQDVIWMLIHAVAEATILVVWVGVLHRFYDRYLGFLSIDLTALLPYWGVILLGVVLMDFLRWLQHVLHHKVPWLWQFHTVHHSQVRLNLFTDYRYHAFEYLVRQMICFLPLLAFGLGTYEIFWIALALSWQARLYHANIKTNFGLLRYVLVTPQSHRVHHSIEDRHQDMNYGAFLSVWDFMFGMQCKEFDVYPDTGIRNEHFPLEVSARGLSLLWTPLRQIIYPFQVIGRSIADFVAGGRRS